MDAFTTLERRVDDRVEVNVGLACRVPASPVPATVLDLSHLGCRLEFRDRHLDLGGTVTLEMANGDRVTGEVVWAHASQAGVRFHRRLKSRTASLLGIEQPPADIPEVAPEPGGGLISHWYRRLTGAFSIRPGRRL